MEHLSRLDEHTNEHGGAISEKEDSVPSNQGHIKRNYFNSFTQGENWLDKYMSPVKKYFY